jgi:hypothetical protein
VVGLDGFVDTIVAPVATRTGPGERFKPIDTIEAFGARIQAAAGKSTNIELYPRLDKLGGNGPIMANALLASGLRVRYVGALGDPTPHAVFREFARRTRAVSLCTPAHTIAAEFTDGKIMLGLMRSLDEITFERLVARFGVTALRAELAAADLVALVNWTMIPHMTEVLAHLATTVCPRLPARPRRFFFDLADPEKRAVADLRRVLRLIGRFEDFGRVTLGLNLKEAQQVFRVLGFAPAGEDEAGLRAMAAQIQHRLGLSDVVIHPRDSAVCANADGTCWIPGPYAARPLITTGAGDHFNAGFCLGQLLGLPPESCLCLGVGTSGFYVRTGRSPTRLHLAKFIADWR